MLVLLILFGVGGGLAFYFFSGSPAKTVDHFFAVLKKDGPEASYVLTSTKFRSANTLQKFTAMLKKSLLDRYESAYWNSSTTENNLIDVQGTVATSDQQIPVELLLVNEEGAYKIDAVKLPLEEVKPRQVK